MASKKTAARKPKAKAAKPPKEPPAPPTSPPDGDYEKYREQQAKISRKRSATGREIGPLPAVVNPERRAACETNLELFGQTYFGSRFPLASSTAHRDMIRALQSAIRGDGESTLLAISFMRGGGKTAWGEVAVIFAVVYGFRRFVVLLQATQPLAARSLKKIQREFEDNALLLEDFPEVCYPIRSLERIHNRAKGQRLNNVPTRIEWTGDGVVMPTVAGSPASGATVHVAGITGALKGLSATSPDGGILRPDLVILDDCQTRESAKSPTQTADRESIITDDILGLAGPMKTIAAVNLCTPIYVNDLSERFLDRERHPEWNGLRTKMLPRFPDNLDLWDEFAEVRRNEGPTEATKFYQARRDEMDIGAVVTWPERTRAGEVSASTGLELAMILYYTNPRGFHAEYQCEPDEVELGVGSKAFDATAIAARTSGADRLQVPPDCTRLTAFIDCGAGLHWYGVVAWTEKMGGVLIDYGTWPRQNRSMFAADDPRPSLTTAFAAREDIKSEQQRVYAGLEALTTEILGRTYSRVGGGEVNVEICMIDSGWETKTIYQFCAKYGKHFACPVHPSKGIGRTATARGVSEWKPRPGERKGYFWRLTSGEYDRTRAVQFDPDAWKSWLHGALNTAAGGPTAMFFYGDPKAKHEMLGEHCAAEFATPVTVRGATFDKWEQRPDRPDNHLLDVLVGCCVGASVLGLQWSATPTGTPEKKERPKLESWADMARRKAEERAKGMR